MKVPYRIAFFVMFFLGNLTFAVGQHWEFGMAGGPMFYQGDLAKPFIQKQMIRGFAGIEGMYHFNPKVSVYLSLSAGKVAGDDQYAPSTTTGMEHRIRNLSFQSNISECSGGLELNLLRFEPDSRSHWFTPYFSAGLGLFHFNPKTVYQGQTITLHDLMTEFQKPDYSLTQVCVPLGVGVKLKIANAWTLCFGYFTRFLNTDYLDDVSYLYQSSPTPGNLGQELSYRGDERNYGNLANSGLTGTVNSKVDFRGNPDNKDSYTMISFRISRRILPYVCGGF